MNCQKSLKKSFVRMFVLLAVLALAATGCGQQGEETAGEEGQMSTQEIQPQQLGEKPQPAEKLTVGLVQLAFVPGDVDKNIETAGRLVDEAVEKGAGLVVLPELWSIGYGLKDPAALAENEEGKTYQFMQQKAKEKGIYLCGGWPEAGANGKAYDSAAFFDPQGKLLLNHRKVELYTPLGEDKVWAAGNRYDVVDTAFGRVGILICYDGDFPEPWRILAANKGADLILHPTAYESPCEDLGWWDKLYEAGAMQNACWLVSANMAGQTPDGDNFFGGSRVINPLGNTVASAPFVKPGEAAQSQVLLVTLDFAQGLADGEESNGSIVTDRKVEVFRANGL